MLNTIASVIAGRTLKLGLLMWLFAELFTFILVAESLGIGRALLLGFLSSALGIFMLARLGRDAATDLRQLFGQRDGFGQRTSLADRTLTAIGATLLILPGFLSDFLGLALLVPGVRGWLAKRFIVVKTSGRRPNAASSSPEVIELQAGEWRHIEERNSV